MGWNHELNIYNFPILNFLKLKVEINSQVTTTNLDEKLK